MGLTLEEATAQCEELRAKYPDLQFDPVEQKTGLYEIGQKGCPRCGRKPHDMMRKNIDRRNWRSAVQCNACDGRDGYKRQFWIRKGFRD